MIYVLIRASIDNFYKVNKLIDHLESSMQEAEIDYNLPRTWTKVRFVEKYDRYLRDLELYIKTYYQDKIEWEVHREDTNERYLNQYDPEVSPALHKQNLLPLFKPQDVWNL